ncbi:MAG TPA: ABC transporter ATP-binding protein [Candidatus Limadaptatus stercoravium]|nr:ABC transporter ATP-binding protein [Candidatus Limadaptatus stercoravium]
MSRNKKPERKAGKYTAGHPMATFKRILSYFAPYKGRVVLAGISLVLNVAATVGGTFMLSVIIDDYIGPLASGASGVTMADFALMTGIMAAMYLVGVLLQYTYNWIIVNMTTQIQRNIRDQMFENMQKLPIRFFDTHANGDIMSCYTNDTDTLRELMANGVPYLISNGLTVLAIFIMMLVLNPLLTLFIIVMLVIMFAIVKFVGGKSGKHFVRQQKAIGVLDGYVEEHIEGMRVVKVFCHEDAEKEAFDRINGELRGASRKAHTYANILMPILGNLSYVNYAITAIAGTLFALSGVAGMTIGKLISFLQFSRQFSAPIGQMSQQMNSILMALAGAERIFALIDAKPEEDEGYVTLVNAEEAEDGTLTESDVFTGKWAWKHYHKADDTTTYVKWTGEVEFEDVTFGYVPEKTVLKHINLVAEPGQKIALVGSTGAGKTTITNLINRFYDIEDGKIRYDNINIKKIQKPALRRSLGMVLQDTHLFTGTVRDNIRYGKLDATDEEVENAAKLANADAFIRHLPEGYDTMLSGDGSNLSQGQRQLLSIARAAVANPPVLILDEATSSIDTRTEKLIEKGMDSLMRGRTVFIIAHRLSTVRNADMILVLEHGEIIERGNHEQLIAQKGRYYQLYTGAFELD